MDGSIPTKSERFAEFLRRLGATPAASSFDEAYRQVCDTLNGVEDDMTAIPFDPPNWMTDGRLDPPQVDQRRDVPGRAGLKRFRNRRHLTFIDQNGAIEIQDPRGHPIFAKAGSDGRLI